MSVTHYYEMCQRYKGRAVVVRTHDGKSHTGIIRYVTPNQVYLQPTKSSSSLSGFSYGYPGYGYGGYGYGGWGWGITLATIAAIALLPFFFW